MSRKSTTVTKGLSETTGVILLDSPARVMPTEELLDWCDKHFKETKTGLLADLWLLSSLSTPINYTIWEGIFKNYERQKS